MERRSQDMTRTLPDGMTGAIMAVEGISDAALFLHGPGGCRVRHMVVSSAVYPKDFDEGNLYAPYYYGYPQVPATYLDEYDFINGAYYKSEEGLAAVGERDPSLIVVLDSPGAGLIGDDHSKAAEENDLSGITLVLGESLASEPATVSCGRTLAKVMDFLDPREGRTREGTVNLLGLSIMDKDWKAARDELCGLLEDMGLEVIACPGAGSSVEDLIRSVDAEHNVVVCPEMCSGLVEWYASRGVDSIVSDHGAPVGFDAVESWIGKVAEVTGHDPTRALEKVERARGKVLERFTGMRYNAARIRGMTFSAAGTASAVRPLTEWLYSYLAMAPAAVAVDPGADPHETECLSRFLEDVGFSEAWDREPVDCGVVLCEGVEALTMKLSDRCRIGIPIGYSSMGIDDVIPRPVYGIQGAFYILDELLHGVRST